MHAPCEVVGLCFLLLLAGVSAACSADNCSACGESECRPSNGCHDSSPDDWEPAFCIACNETDRCGGGMHISIDASLACTAEDNVIASVLLGVLAGAFLCLLPCCFLCMRERRAWSRAFMDATNPRVRRTQAVIKDKQTHENESKRASHTLVVAFKAQTDKGQTVPIRAQVMAMDSVWARLVVGGETEVAYTINNPKEFIIMEDQKERELQGPKLQRLVLGVSMCFATVGLACGIVTLPLTGCFLGFIPMGLILVGGILCGRVAVLPISRKIATCSFYVSDNGGEAPSEHSLVMNGRSAGDSERGLCKA